VAKRSTTIAPGVTSQEVPDSPPMWKGPATPGYPGYAGPPENWTQNFGSASVNEMVNPDDMIVSMGGQERLGARYSIDVMIPYNEPANWQPTRASEFYGQISSSRS
jgi:hypothetical protein